MQEPSSHIKTTQIFTYMLSLNIFRSSLLLFEISVLIICIPIVSYVRLTIVIYLLNEHAQSITYDRPISDWFFILTFSINFDCKYMLYLSFRKSHWNILPLLFVVFFFCTKWSRTKPVWTWTTWLSLKFFFFFFFLLSNITNAFFSRLIRCHSTCFCFVPFRLGNAYHSFPHLNITIFFLSLILSLNLFESGLIEGRSHYSYDTNNLEILQLIARQAMKNNNLDLNDSRV